LKRGIGIWEVEKYIGCSVICKTGHYMLKKEGIVKKVKKIVLIVISVIVLVPALVFLGICAQSYYMNMNPDHVDLKKDGWVKVIAFTTVWKKIPVEIYGRPGKEENSGEFVVVRKGVLPFGLMSITGKYECKNIWSYYSNYSATENKTIKASTFMAQMGPFFSDRIPSKLIPSIMFSFVKLINEEDYRLTGISYMLLDDIQTVVKKESIFIKLNIYNSCENIFINKEISKHFPYPKQED
jgi:hypothetical protein